MTLFESLQSELKTLMSQVELNSVEFYYGTPWDQPGDKVYGNFTVYKSDDEQKMVYGYASVIEIDGKTLIDKHGDTISEEALVKAAHIFMSRYREGKEMHKGDQVGEVVESIVFTHDLQKALDIDLGCVGWFVGYKVHKEEVWEKVKKGELSMFSIGGRATREAVQ